MLDLNALASAFLEHGLVGAVAVGALWFAFRKDAKFEASQEARIAEGRESVKALEQSTNVANSQAELLEQLLGEIRNRKDT